MLVIMLLLAIHLVAAVLGRGMAFAYAVLRTAAGALDPAVRLPLWRQRVRGLPPVGRGEHRGAAGDRLRHDIPSLRRLRGRRPLCPRHEDHGHHHDAALPASPLRPLRRFRNAVDQGALPEAAKYLNQMRIIVGINLLLGVLTIIIGGTGRYW